MSFAILKPGAKVFRVKVHQVSAYLGNATANHNAAWFVMNWDSFQSKTSPSMTNSDVQNPEWRDWELRFQYTTEYHHMLIVKTFRMSIYAKDPTSPTGEAFMGEVAVDLQTIACGPEEVHASVKMGDMTVGQVNCIVECEEIAETFVELHELNILMPTLSLPVEECVVTVRTKSDPPYEFTTGPPVEVLGDRTAVWKGGDGTVVGTHFFGTTVASFQSSAGFHLEVYHGARIVSRGMLMFSEHMDDSSHKAAHHIGERDASSASIIFQGVEMRDEDGSNVVGTASGMAMVRNLPTFVQMYKGKSVDGIVCGDWDCRPGVHPMPPRVRAKPPAAPAAAAAPPGAAAPSPAAGAPDPPAADQQQPAAAPPGI